MLSKKIVKKRTQKFKRPQSDRKISVKGNPSIYISENGGAFAVEEDREEEDPEVQEASK